MVRDTDDNDRGEIYLINANGTNVRRILDDQGYEHPIWSPDGSRIATLVNTSRGTRPVVILDVEFHQATTIGLPDGDYDAVTWSPNGQHVSFSGFDHTREPVVPTPDVPDPDRSAIPGVQVAKVIYPQIYIANADGSGVHRLFDNDTERYQSPVWSPDGERIAFVGHDAQLWIANADGSNVVQASTNQQSVFFPVWSPDGSQVAFVGYPDEYPGIYIVNADGSNQTRVVPEGFAGWMPAWSPDGTELAFGHFAGREYELHVVTIATGKLRKLASVRSRSMSPGWSPDGEWVAFTAEMGLGERAGPIHLSIVNAHDPDAETKTIVRDLVEVSRPAWRPSGH